MQYSILEKDLVLREHDASAILLSVFDDDDDVNAIEERPNYNYAESSEDDDDEQVDESSAILTSPPPRDRQLWYPNGQSAAFCNYYSTHLEYVPLHFVLGKKNCLDDSGLVTRDGRQRVYLKCIMVRSLSRYMMKSYLFTYCLGDADKPGEYLYKFRGCLEVSAYGPVEALKALLSNYRPFYTWFT